MCRWNGIYFTWQRTKPDLKYIFFSKFLFHVWGLQQALVTCLRLWYLINTFDAFGADAFDKIHQIPSKWLFRGPWISFKHSLWIDICWNETSNSFHWILGFPGSNKQCPKIHGKITKQYNKYKRYCKFILKEEYIGRLLPNILFFISFYHFPATTMTYKIFHWKYSETCL